MSWRPDFSQPSPKVQTLAEARALIEARWAIAWQTIQQVEALQAQLAELQAPRGLSSRNSSQPPSQDGPGAPRPPLQKKSGRSRGGQKGHPGHSRAWLAPEQVDTVIEGRPSATGCGGGQPLPVAQTPSWRHQVTELPKVKPQGTEYQGVDITCPHCGALHKADRPKGVPAGQLGPRLLAEIGRLAGAIT